LQVFVHNGVQIYVLKMSCLNWCTILPALQDCVPEQMCKCQDSRNNTFTCVRHIEPHITSQLMSSYNFLFCRFKDSEVSQQETWVA